MEAMATLVPSTLTSEVVSEPMPDPRNRPSRYTSEPYVFGKAATIAWLPAAPGTKEQLLAAQMQHYLALAINTAAKSRYGSLTVYAKVANVKYRRLTRILRGDVVMRLEDIASARRHLGIDVSFGS